jgi:transcription elongation GreA/GreB family factor
VSRGFVREDDLELAGTDLPERPISEHPNYVTPTGLAQLEAQVEALSTKHSTLSPQKEDPIISQQLAVTERDLRYFEARLEQAILVEAGQDEPTIVVFGTSVMVEDEEGNQHTFQIVGEDEADVNANKVSYVSPLAKALIGHRAGETVKWMRPAGNVLLDIISITY